MSDGSDRLEMGLSVGELCAGGVNGLENVRGTFEVAGGSSFLDLLHEFRP